MGCGSSRDVTKNRIQRIEVRSNNTKPKPLKPDNAQPEYFGANRQQNQPENINVESSTPSNNKSELIEEYKNLTTEMQTLNKNLRPLPLTRRSLKAGTHAISFGTDKIMENTRIKIGWIKTRMREIESIVPELLTK